VAKSCEHDNEISGSVKGGEFVHWLKYFELPKKVCISRSQLHSVLHDSLETNVSNTAIN